MRWLAQPGIISRMTITHLMTLPILINVAKKFVSSASFDRGFSEVWKQRGVYESVV